MSSTNSTCYTSSNNVMYVGANLPNTHINTGDSLSLSLSKIDNVFNQSNFVQYIADNVITGKSILIDEFRIADISANTPNIPYSAPIVNSYFIRVDDEFESFTSITFPEITNCNNIGISGNNTLSTISFPKLTKLVYNYIGDVNNGFNINGATIQNLNFPLLEKVNSIFSFSIVNTSVATLAFPKLYDCNINSYSNISSNVNLTSLSFSNNIKNIFSTLYFNYNAFSASTVNYILAMLVSLDGTNGTTLWIGFLNVSGGTNAAPSGQGILDVATLVARGATIVTN